MENHQNISQCLSRVPSSTSPTLSTSSPLFSPDNSRSLSTSKYCLQSHALPSSEVQPFFDSPFILHLSLPSILTSSPRQSSIKLCEGYLSLCLRSFWAHSRLSESLTFSVTQNSTCACWPTGYMFATMWQECKDIGRENIEES